MKPTTSYDQLQALAEKNHCIIKEENQYAKNQFMMSVHKNAELNALGMSNVFYETELFEYAQPNMLFFTHGIKLGQMVDTK